MIGNRGRQAVQQGCILTCLIALVGDPGQSGSRDRGAGDPGRNTNMSELSKSEEITIRKHVYSGEHLTAVPKSGEFARYTVLVVPEEVKAIFARKRPATLRLLAVMVEGARPEDALLAAGYAAALADSPVEGALLSTYPKGSFDEIKQATGTTQRDFVMQQIREMIHKASAQD
jgi:hypothetical protein